MADNLTTVAAMQVPCKCCRRPSPLFGVVDFNRSCEDGLAKPLPVCGIPVYYHRCTFCELIFTAASDAFTLQDFAARIYNDEYIKVDPDYVTARPQMMARHYSTMFAACKEMRVLDYGCGNGLMVQGMRERGFTRIEGYDPMVPAFSKEPDGLFDLILSTEVMEHSPTPVETFRQAAGFLADPGLMAFTTLLQPHDIATAHMNWWYIAPRNGHVTMHSKRSLELATALVGCKVGSFSEALHCAFKTVPDWAKEILFKEAKPTA